VSEDRTHILILNEEGANLIKRIVFQSCDEAAVVAVGMMYMTMTALNCAVDLIKEKGLYQEFEDRLLAQPCLRTRRKEPEA
jgi:hypothetical protein